MRVIDILTSPDCLADEVDMFKFFPEVASRKDLRNIGRTGHSSCDLF